MTTLLYFLKKRRRCRFLLGLSMPMECMNPWNEDGLLSDAPFYGQKDEYEGALANLMKIDAFITLANLKDRSPADDRCQDDVTEAQNAIAGLDKLDERKLNEQDISNGNVRLKMKEVAPTLSSSQIERKKTIVIETIQHILKNLPFRLKNQEIMDRVNSALEKEDVKFFFKDVASFNAYLTTLRKKKLIPQFRPVRNRNANKKRTVVIETIQHILKNSPHRLSNQKMMDSVNSALEKEGVKFFFKDVALFNVYLTALRKKKLIPLFQPKKSGYTYKPSKKKIIIIETIQHILKNSPRRLSNPEMKDRVNAQLEQEGEDTFQTPTTFNNYLTSLRKEKLIPLFEPKKSRYANKLSERRTVVIETIQHILKNPSRRLSNPEIMDRVNAQLKKEEIHTFQTLAAFNNYLFFLRKEKLIPCFRQKKNSHTKKLTKKRKIVIETLQHIFKNSPLLKNSPRRLNNQEIMDSVNAQMEKKGKISPSLGDPEKQKG